MKIIAVIATLALAACGSKAPTVAAPPVISSTTTAQVPTDDCTAITAAFVETIDAVRVEEASLTSAADEALAGADQLGVTSDAGTVLLHVSDNLNAASMFLGQGDEDHAVTMLRIAKTGSRTAEQGCV